MTFGSLFSGIGGIDLGLERAGMVCRWQCEIDQYATQVLEKHWPGLARYQDITKINTKKLEKVDLIAGGFPCQDISIAGDGEGLYGKRSGLFFELMRIVGDLRPKHILLENVSALLVRGLDAVLGTLAEVGYNAEWHCIPASYVGAPHRRDRIWIVAHANGSGLEGQRGEHQLREDRKEGPISRSGEMADTTGERSSGQGQPWQASSTTEAKARQAIRFEHGGFRDQWSVEPDVGRVANGVPHRMDRLKCLGNAVVPQVVEHLAKGILDDVSRH